MGTQNLLEKVRGLLRGRKGDIDKGLDKAERVVSEKTGGKYDDQMGSVREKADEALSEDARSDGADTADENAADQDEAATDKHEGGGTERPPG